MKRLIDLLIALAMVILFPVFLFTALLIRLNSPGLFFLTTSYWSQWTDILMIKFRTMINNKAWALVFILLRMIPGH